MGHLIVGELPRRPAWLAVASLLGDERLTAADLSRLTMVAADDRLVQLRGDRALSYCFWLLTRLAAASRGPDFTADVHQLGINVTPKESTLQFIARVSERVRQETVQFSESGPFGDMAAQALSQALMETAGRRGTPLLKSTVDEIAAEFRRYSTATQFGDVSQRFFGAFVSRTLRFYIERAVMHTVGAGPLGSISAAADFLSAVDDHARTTARIVEDFATGWYSKKLWAANGVIARDDAQAFTAHALTKLRGELKRSGVH